MKDISERSWEERAKAFSSHKRIRPLVADPCMRSEKLLYDGEELRVLEVEEARDFSGLLRLRKAWDTDLSSAVHYFANERSTNPYIDHVLQLFEWHEKSVYETIEESEILELLVFSVIRWQRSCCLLVRAWKAICYDNSPIDDVCKLVVIDMVTASWEEIATEGVEMLYEW